MYCMLSGAFDALGYYRYWIFPTNGVAVLILFGSAVLFPISAAVAVKKSHWARPVLVTSAHAVMSVGQVLGLMESFC